MLDKTGLEGQKRAVEMVGHGAGLIFFFFRAEHVSVWFSICSISIVEYFNFHANSHLIVFLLFFGVLYDHLPSNYYEKYAGSHVSISDV